VPVLISWGRLSGLACSLVGLAWVLIVPVLTWSSKLPVAFAIGASIISVIRDLQRRRRQRMFAIALTNLRLACSEIATTIGAISGAFLAGCAGSQFSDIIFGSILLVSAAPLVATSEGTPRGAPMIAGQPAAS